MTAAARATATRAGTLAPSELRRTARQFANTRQTRSHAVSRAPRRAPPCQRGQTTPPVTNARTNLTLILWAYVGARSRNQRSLRGTIKY
eukprot:6314703-Lingulodinium_polyedra.AAC.1